MARSGESGFGTLQPSPKAMPRFEIGGTRYGSGLNRCPCLGAYARGAVQAARHVSDPTTPSASRAFSF